jgi:hypothetical protein
VCVCVGVGGGGEIFSYNFLSPLLSSGVLIILWLWVLLETLQVTPAGIDICLHTAVA